MTVAIDLLRSDLALVLFIPSWWRRLLRAPTRERFARRTREGVWHWESGEAVDPDIDIQIRRVWWRYSSKAVGQ